MGAFLHQSTPASIAKILDGKCELESIVALQAVGDNLPIICVHAHMGHLYNLRQLADRFAPDTPFFGMQMMNSGELPAPSISLMATRYQELISRHLSFEDYCLAGYCFGGWVAVEMARQKIERDEDPGILILIDPDLPVKRPKQRSRSVFTFWKQIFSTPPNKVFGNLVNKWQLWTRIIRDQLWILAYKTGISGPTLKTSPEYICCIAAHNYSPRPYPGRVHLFLPEIKYSQEILEDWITLFPGEMQITTIAAGPKELLREPATRQLGDAILLHLARDRLKTRKDF